MREGIKFFDSFQLDPTNARLRKNGRDIFLTPKAFDVLRYLAEHVGQLVTKDALWRAVWPDVSVTDAALTVCMSELRRALGDEAKTPRYIQTVHRRGYRFIAPVTEQPSLRGIAGVSARLGDAFVGRQAELRQLHSWLEKALKGERQIVFVSGEPGIGKTALVEAFLEQIADDKGVRVGRGQCIEHYGTGEAYLPLLEALGRLCREPQGTRLIELLHRYAPTWLAQMPALLGTTELDSLQKRVAGATRERMLRELAEAIEVITAEVPLVLLLEDLHWSDFSTLDWLAYLAHRTEPARLLVLGTFRPVELMVRDHPLNTVKQELQMHGRGNEIPLALLTESAVVQYVKARFASLPRESLRELGHMIHQRTEGNPLFMIKMLDYLMTKEALVQSDGRWRLKKDLLEADRSIPEGPRQMIMRQIDQLGSTDRQVLEAASVVGAEFAAAAVAAGLELTMREVEERCQLLARRGQFLQEAGASQWPDGTAAASYRFIHALYQEVLYARIPMGRRIDLHYRIGQGEERAYGDRAGEIAVELATHFEQSRDYSAAIKYRQLAGENATRISAHHEAIEHFGRALELMMRELPDNAQRVQQELSLQVAIGFALNAVRGWAAPEVENAFTRARELCHRLGDPPELFPAMLGIWAAYYLRGELRKAYELGGLLLRGAESAQDPGLLLYAHLALGDASFSMGEWLRAREHLELALSFYDRKGPILIGHDAGVNCLSYMALVLWALGYPDQALKDGDAAIELAQALSHPLSLAFAQGLVGYFLQYRREADAARQISERLIALSAEQGFAHWLAQGLVTRGWALAAQGHHEEGIARIREGLAAFRAIGVEALRPHDLCLLADACIKAGRLGDGLDALSEALDATNKHGIRHCEAEIHRLEGEILLQQDDSNVEEAERCLRSAIDIAQQQNAKSFELRATTSLARLLASQSGRDEARTMLAEIYNWFTEGFDTADLKDAKALLDELAN